MSETISIAKLRELIFSRADRDKNDGLAFGLISGPEGPEGKQGPAGERGPCGQRGETGLPGERGERGPQGLKGERGEKGPQGERGDTGLSGLPGSKGERGERGEQGEPGPQGDRCDIGPQGPAGKDGLGRDEIKTLVSEFLVQILEAEHLSAARIVKANKEIEKVSSDPRYFRLGAAAQEIVERFRRALNE